MTACSGFSAFHDKFAPMDSIFRTMTSNAVVTTPFVVTIFHHRFFRATCDGPGQYKREFVMKRFWQTWLALAVTTVVVGTVDAQTDWTQAQADVGSYQSILARAGYSHLDPTLAKSSNTVPGPTMNGQSIPAPSMNRYPATNYGGNCGDGCDGGCHNGYSNGGCIDSGCADTNCGCRRLGQGRKQRHGCGQAVGADSGCVSGGPVSSGFVNRGYDDVCDEGSVYGSTGGGFGSKICGKMGGLFSRGPGSNYVLGVGALFLARDYEDDVRLSRNDVGGTLLSTDADMGTMGGVYSTLTKRNSSGRGVQFGYWGLYPSQSNASLGGPMVSTYLTSFDSLSVAPGPQNLWDYFNNSDSHQIYRENEIHNVEMNLLQNVGSYTTRRGRAGNFEMLGGFRWFQFNENFGYSALYAAANPNQVDYEIANQNTLLGFQVGGRNELCVSNRLSLVTASKVGLFTNFISSDQSIRDSNGGFAYRTAGGVDDFNYMHEKHDLSMLGELDLGMAYRITNRCRATFGYRALGVSGIALAPDQIPRDFGSDVGQINSNGNLILGGGYAGLEFCR